ncbi:3-beta-hydroxysteroid-Delta(8),Delta(7)-isomerase [Cordyceps militaris]|uniref:3-beta-hydroxysteroid-Delta(8), Delta(7)-isomerase n=1 Tax=Cordyceps militaris TaxID=73501 RepID=A0A2H4SJT1_CORMI|nr:3-beta-hydroxysteroid-Delta(8),Delta(7)-isomerase [Cordyceps militaris]
MRHHLQSFPFDQSSPFDQAGMNTFMEQFGTVAATLVVPANRSHPFYPVDLRVPGYIATSTPTAVLLTIFFGGLLMLITTTRYFLRGLKPQLSNGDTWTATWFVICGFIHSLLEGYFSWHSLQMGGRTDLFGQLWKEYSLSDSRYMTQDSFVVCMETVTAVLWGPLSFLCAYMIVTDHTARHSVQLTVSFGQLYGLVLYFATCTFEELVHGVVLSHPAPIYFWAYYITCNAFWLFIPGWLIYQSLSEVQAAFAYKAQFNAVARQQMRKEAATL